MVFYSLLEKLYDITKGSDGIRVEIMPIAGQSLDRVSLVEWTIFGIALVLAFAFGTFMMRLISPPRWARRWPASRRARRGSNSWACRRAACCSPPMSISAIVGGFGGALIAMTSRHVTPLLAYWTASGELVFIAILGGAGGVLGPFLGAPPMSWCASMPRRSFADAWQMILGTVLLLVILFAPGGLWGMGRALIIGERRAMIVLLRATGLRLAFGGVKAADGIDLDVTTRRVPRHHRPERRGQDHLHQHDDRLSDSRKPAPSATTAGRSPARRRAPSSGSASRGPSSCRSSSSNTRSIRTSRWPSPRATASGRPFDRCCARA